MREPRSNIGRVCPDCALKPNPEWCRLPADFFVGKCCKLGFDTGLKDPPQEHMWVACTGEVQGDGQEHLQGTLNNDPDYVADLEDGDALLFDREDVEAVWDERYEQSFKSPLDHPEWARGFKA